MDDLKKMPPSILKKRRGDYGDASSVGSPLDSKYKLTQERLSDEEWANARSFGGAIGVTALSILLPLLVIFLVFVHENVSNPTWRNLLHWIDLDHKRLIKLIKPELIAGVFGWVALQAALYRLVPCGGVVYGPPRIDGGELMSYRTNGEFHVHLPKRRFDAGFYTLGIVVDAFLVAYFVYAYPVHQLFRRNWLELCVAVLIATPIMGLLAHLYALLSGSEENARAQTGNFVYDMWMGRAMNPRPLGVDLKHLFATRIYQPIWLMYIWSLLLHEWELAGNRGRTYDNYTMMYIVLAQTMYILWTTWDERHYSTQFTIDSG